MGDVHYVDLGAVRKQLLQCLELLVDLIPSPLQISQIEISETRNGNGIGCDPYP